MAKGKSTVLLVSCLAATIVTGLAFLNNLVAIVNWWRAFLAAGGDSSRFSAKASGIIPWLDWTAVDYSAVTTLIPFLGCVCLSRAVFALRRGKSCAAADFPFFRGSDQLNVALGLFGTLWGIIVIGYFRLDTVSMADLMQCLHTALFSTLTAVVWVFMIDRPLVRPYFQRLLRAAKLDEMEEGDLSAAVERLVTRLGEASEAFDARQKAFDNAFAKRQDRYEKTFAERQQKIEAVFARRMTETETAFAAREKAYEESFERRLKDCETACEAYRKACDDVFRRRLEELEHHVAEERERADRLADKLSAVTNALR